MFKLKQIADRATVKWVDGGEEKKPFTLYLNIMQLFRVYHF